MVETSVGILFVGTGHQTMTHKLPRPCRYGDLTHASRSRKLPQLALIADGKPQEFASAISTWRTVVPSTRLFIFHTPAFTEAVRMAKNTDSLITAIEVPSYNQLNHTTEALAYPIWASCAPYDAYGVLIKNFLESTVYSIIRYNRGFYLAHDPAYGVIRWFDSNGLRDRLHYRGFRLLIYRWICKVMHGFSWISSRVSTAEFRWRRIR